MRRRKSEAGSNKPDNDLQAIYQRLRRRFSAAELQKYTEIENGIPARQILSELEAAQRKHTGEK
jgi:hypothetical protein